MNNLTNYGGYIIEIKTDVEKDGIYVVAYCPICGDSQESHDHGLGEKHAQNISIGKIRSHLRLEHKIQDVSEDNGKS